MNAITCIRTLSLNGSRAYLDEARDHNPQVFINAEMYVCVCEQIRKTQAEPQWIVAQRLLSALTIPGFT